MITVEQRDARQSHIGGSDAPVIAGEIGSRYDLWLEKTGQLRPGKQNAAMVAGSYLERGLVDWAADEIGVEIVRDVPTLVHSDGVRAANLDGLVPAEAIVEAKLSGFMSGRVFEGELWGTPGTDQVPPRVVLQCQHNMMVASDYYGAPIRKAYVPAGLVGVGLSLYVVQWSDRLADLLADLEGDFWNSNVLARVPPEDTTPTIDTLRRAIRVTGKTAPLSVPAVERWLHARAQAGQWDKEKDAAFGALLAELGDAEIGESPLGKLVYREEQRPGYVVGPKAFRMPRWTKNKEGANV